MTNQQSQRRPPDQKKSPASRVAYWLRDRLNGDLFAAISRRNGHVLDVGGGAFFERLARRGHVWESFTILEPRPGLDTSSHDNVQLVLGDGQALPFAEGSFDEVLAIQVLEHVFRPDVLVQEMWRVLRPNGRMIIMVPQSGNLHQVPHHYANLTRFWLFEIAQRLHAEVEVWKPLGGAWRTIASRLFLLLWPVFDWHQTQDRLLHRRGIAFWVTLPLQVVVVLIFFPLALVLSFADIKEEANNHLIVLRKPSS